MKLLKTSILFFQFLFFVSAVQAQDINSVVKDNYGREKLLGRVNKQGLTTNTFNAWFSASYDRYNIDKEALKKIKKDINDYKITVFMGTWCGDSRREVPRFYKILESLDYPMHKLKIIGVDNIPGAYKKSPGKEEEGLNIIKVPTFIFYKNGKEVNRIVESPVISLESDIEKIMYSTEYKHKYF
ncbi:thiol reductase thioredoxin [Flavobacteriaceae bacterium R38]|nr:thiol reductase thioredoxin [Flavobacteriaceae bacterium R38]